MSSIQFYLRHSSRGSNYPGSLCVRIIHRRKVKVVTTSCRLYPDEWDVSRAIPIKQTLSRHTLIDETNSYLGHIQSLFEDLSDKLFPSSTVQDIARVLFCKPDKQKSLLSYTNELTRQLENKGQTRTARAYHSATNRFIDFNKRRNMLLDDIHPELVIRFEQHLKTEGKHSQRTAKGC